MALSLSFLKRKLPLSSGKGMVPSGRVNELTSKGFSELEVIDVLRKEGYSPEEIDKALTYAVRIGIGAGPQQQNKPEQQSKLPVLEDLTPAKIEMPQIPETQLPETAQSYPTEEYIDYVVRERTDESNQRVSEMSIKVGELEKRMEDIRDQMSDLINSRTGAQTEILNKIDAFKEIVSEVELRMGSLEKAFKETLPALIESVRALSDLVQRMKREA